jgi:hypothetical protein
LWKDLRHKGAATAQARAAWGMNQDIGLFYKILKLYTRMTLNLGTGMAYPSSFVAITAQPGLAKP